MTLTRVRLPEPHAAQRQALQGGKRFNIVAAGEQWGKTALGIEALLTGKRGALSGKSHVAWFAATEDKLVEARRAVLRAVEPLIQRRVNARRVELTTGGVIDFWDMEKPPDAFEQYGVIVVDDARMVAGLLDMWEDVLKPSLIAKNGRAWILSGAYGKRNDFYRLWRAADGDPDWARHQFDSDTNPHLPELARVAAAECTDVEYQQRFGAEFLDVALELTREQRAVKPGETFLQWCERLEQDGLMVDGHPFSLSDRPAMRFIYELIPSTVEDAFGRIDVIMKCTQVGFTVYEMLASIYLALRFSPAKIGLFMPSQMLAAGKSSQRFMPIVRTIPQVHDMMAGSATGRGEGNVLIRNLGESRFHFLWTTGKTATESFPMDVISFDEVQEMAVADMEKTRERLSASKIRYTLMGSTANWPDADIHWWYKRGTQHQFHTECPSCGKSMVLDEHFPQCIGFDPEAPRVIQRGDRSATVLGEYRYKCVHCDGWIDDPQRGMWLAKEPDAEIRSVHFPQFLSPTISPRDIITAYHTADDMKNFFNRKLGKPYTDPSQVPINLEMLNACAEEGRAAGLQWRRNASGAFMGLDQMGNFIVAILCERMADGRQAIIHLEYIYISPTADNPDASPWDRADELMQQYRVQCCVVETLPNYDSAKSFARRHNGRVFLADYRKIEGEMMRWGDTPRPDASDRRTDDEARDKFTVALDQYKCMQVALSRIQTRTCLFPDPDGLVQEVVEKGQRRMAAVCKEYAFFHFTRTALVAEKDEEEKKFKRRVVKVGIDPHTSYAFMLMNVAWARAYGTSTFIMPDAQRPKDMSAAEALQTVAPQVTAALDQLRSAAMTADTCGRCTAYSAGICLERSGLLVKETDAGCDAFLPA